MNKKFTKKKLFFTLQTIATAGLIIPIFPIVTTYCLFGGGDKEIQMLEESMSTAAEAFGVPTLPKRPLWKCRLELGYLYSILQANNIVHNVYWYFKGGEYGSGEFSVIKQDEVLFRGGCSDCISYCIENEYKYEVDWIENIVTIMEV